MNSATSCSVRVSDDAAAAFALYVVVGDATNAMKMKMRWPVAVTWAPSPAAQYNLSVKCIRYARAKRSIDAAAASTSINSVSSTRPSSSGCGNLPHFEHTGERIAQS